MCIRDSLARVHRRTGAVMENARSILWRRTTPPGHEAAHLHFDGRIWNLQGSAVFGYDGQACRIEYVVSCDSAWETVSGLVTGSLGNRAIGHRIEAGVGHIWKLNGDHAPAVDG